MSLSSITSPLSLECSDADILEGFGGSELGVTVKNVRDAVEECGIICASDPRLKNVLLALDAMDHDRKLTKREFFQAISDNVTLLHRIATKEMVIRDFQSFSTHLDYLKDSVEPETSGQNADYIPTLKNAPSDVFAVAFCSTDGQFYESGQSRQSFSIQSTCKPIMFALALQKMGTDKVLEWCGIEPSGRPFNDTKLMEDKRPFNPMVNSGALMTAALLAAEYPHILENDFPNKEDGAYAKELCDEILLPLWRTLSANGIVGDVGFCRDTFLSERDTADTNIGIAHIMKAQKGLPPNVSTQTMIDFYLRSCSLTSNTATMAVVASTLANGGKNPITGEQIFSVDVVKKTLSVLSFCGFYDNSGEFFFHTGVPSKSGVSGIVFLVLPNVGGFAIFSPRIDKHGNSVRGSLFAKRLMSHFTFHSYDSLSSLSTGCRLDPRYSCDFSRQRDIARLRWALKAGGEHARNFDRLLLNICVRVGLIDGKLDSSVIKMLTSSYESVMCTHLPRGRLEGILAELEHDVAEKALDSMYELVSAEAHSLNDTEKELILAAAVKVTTANHEISDRERSILRTLCQALRVDNCVLDMRLSLWEKELKKGRDRRLSAKAKEKAVDLDLDYAKSLVKKLQKR
ncbi:Glutaminase kidney isoform, mitochondrial [Gracilariopsis chorda]|uniref:glutaminase n=1 Tax=Gracilariopsis chorda TaxID=448386 RepID=A0A2V3IJR4_9FLOR|nr:Glutaminase kidney isoform, mitochondrial [Gracilariopsis chorda]|eukprot:PXF42336.1 Glutaminase kidney isoform, mitochondrial [Gracilariopsis chorda]